MKGGIIFLPVWDRFFSFWCYHLKKSFHELYKAYSTTFSQIVLACPSVIKFQRKSFSVKKEGGERKKASFTAQHSIQGQALWCVIGFVCVLSHVWLFETPWTAAHQAPLSMGFSRKEYWSGLPFPIPGHLPDPGIELESLASPALAGRFFTTEPPRKPTIGLHR